MCFFCDGGTSEEYDRLVESHIEEYGWHVAGVEPRIGRPWAYTIGLLERYGHPELIISGACCVPCAHTTLNGIGGQIAKGMHYAPGIEAVADDGLGRARFGRVHPRHWQTDLFGSWLRYYDGRPWAPAPEALQVITLGRSGR